MKATIHSLAVCLTVMGVLCLFSQSNVIAQVSTDFLADAGIIRDSPAGAERVRETPPPALEVRTISFEAIDDFSKLQVELDSIRVVGGGASLTLDTMLVGTAVLVLDIATGIDAVPRADGFQLSGNFSNPFNDQTQFVVFSATGGDVTISLYDLNGKRVISSQMSVNQGSSRFVIHGAGLPPGIYLLEARNQNGTRRTSKVMKAGSRGAGSVRIEYGGSVSGLDAAFGKIAEQLNLQVTGYADRYVEKMLDVQIAADTTITFQFSRAEEAPVITQFDANPKSLYAGDKTQFTVICTDWDADLKAMSIDREDDGTYDTTVSLTGDAANEVIEVAFERLGSYLSRLKVEDVFGHSSEAILSSPIIVTEKPENTPPFFVSFTADRTTAALEDTVTFSVLIRDRDDDLLSLKIDFHGDGIWEDSVSVSGGEYAGVFKALYGQEGTFSPTARVTDVPGNYSDTSLTDAITVTDLGKPPEILSFTSDHQIRARNLLTTFVAFVRDADDDHYMAYFDADGDGADDDSLLISGFAETDTLRFVWEYSSPGTFNPEITVTDLLGNKTLRQLASPVEVREAVVRPDVLVILKEEIAAQGITFDSTWVFVVPTAAATQYGFRTGHIVVSDTGMGFQRRVTDVATESHGVRLTTGPASATEIFEQVAFTFSTRLTSGIVQSFDHGHASSFTKASLADSSLSLDMDNFVLYDHDGSGDTEGDRISIDGSIEISPDITYEFEIDQPAGSSAPMVTKANTSVAFSILPEFSVAYGVSDTAVALEQVIETIPFTPFPIFVEGVPIVLTPQMNTYAGVRGRTAAGSVVQTTLESELTVGVAYDSESWTTVEDYSQNFSAEPPEFSGGMQAEGYVEERFLLFANGIVGSSLSAALTGELDADLSRKPIAEVYGGLLAGAEVTPDFLGDTLMRYREDDILDVRVKLYDSGAWEMPTISSINPTELRPGMEVVVSGMNFGLMQAGGKVFFHGSGAKPSYTLEAQDVLHWSDGEIRVNVPAGINSDGIVFINIDGRKSNAVPFTYRDWFYVRGQITDAGSGFDLSGITVTVGNKSALTESDGTFEVSGVPAGSHAVIPTKTCLIFTPDSIEISINGNDVENLQFFASGDASCVPILTTTPVSEISWATATSGGNITSDGGFPVVERGVCWSTMPSPTINDSKTTDGPGLGSFTSSLTGLSPTTTYYVRAYANNSINTGYGNELSFTTDKPSSGTVTDIDGNVYNTVTIGSQVWMVENLKTTRLNDGTPIPLITDSLVWSNLTTPGYTFYYNNASFKGLYGALYNWFAVNTGKLAPAGWHVPTKTDWETLIAYLGGENVAGGKMKEAGTTHWMSPNTGADNSSGFTGIPGGHRSQGIGPGQCLYMDESGWWWASTEYSGERAWDIALFYDHGKGEVGKSRKELGFSVRCVKD